MQFTPNLNLAKPADNDAADIAHLNQNADKIDVAMRQHADDQTTHVGTAEKTTPVDLDYLVLGDSADSGKTKRISLANVKAYLSNTFVGLTHKSRHATGGADAITPADIGAASASHVTDETKHLTAGERAAWNDKVDNMAYGNGQLQLKSGAKNIGLPIAISSGGTINSFVSGVNNFEYIAPANNTKVFVIPIAYNSTKIVTLIRANLHLVQGVDYAVGTDGTVTLVDALANGEKIEGTLQNTSYDANDLLHKEIFVKPSVAFTATIPAASWVGASAPFTYTLSNAAITATSPVEILKDTTTTTTQLTALLAANIQGGTQATGSIVLAAYGTKPTIDVSARFIVRGDL